MSLDNWSQPNTAIPQSGLGQVYWERTETGRESYSRDSSSLERVFCVDYQVSKVFIDDVLGYSFINNSGTISRVLPHRHEDAPGFYAESATLRPFIADGLGVASNNAPTFPLCDITVTYRFPTFAIKTDAEVAGDETLRYVERTEQSAGEFLSTGLMGYAFYTTNASGQTVPVNFSLGVPVGATQLTMTWLEVPALPSNPYAPPTASIYRSMLGKVNGSTFENCPAGTVLFDGVDPKISTPKVVDGSVQWQFAYKFVIRRNGAGVNGDTEAGHNYRYRADLGRFDLVTFGGSATGSRILASGDFSTLFTIPTS